MMDNKDKIRDYHRSKLEGITIVEPEPIPEVDESDKPVRVAAYCRVSTDDEKQTSSFEIQKTYYDEYIAKHKNWVNVGIYADEGLSGTEMEHRDEFNRMILDAKAGKIDMIIVKQTSRFSRNVHDILTVVRELKYLNPPVRVFFEGENIDSLKSDQEMILEMMGMVAEAESRQKSNSMNWSYDRRFERGHFLTPRLFGYDIVDKQYVINEKEAEVVRLVYSMLVTGYTKKQIAEIMTELNYISNVNGECKWNTNVVDNIIYNERRCGKIIARKTYTPNFFDHKSKKNEGLPGQRKLYKMDDHHEGIVPVEMYEYALELKRLYKTAHYYGDIPSLSVINSGALKGFVPVSLRYPGFRYDNYLYASNYVFKLDKEGNRIDDNKTISKQDLSDFDLDGFQKVNIRLMMTKATPSVWFKYDELFFNTTCLRKLGDTDYIEILFEPYEGLLAIRPSDENSHNAIRWVKHNNGKLETIYKKCSGFAQILFECLNWNVNFKYRIAGVTRTSSHGDTIILFNLLDAEAETKEIIRYDDGTEYIAYYIWNDFVDHYGTNFYETAYTNRLYIMDIFKKWKLDAEVVPIKDDEEWLKEAKKLVALHIEKLKKGDNNNGRNQ